jgi:hypothetical protein
MSQINNSTEVYSLNGQSIRLLQLTQETEEKLRLLGIVTLEQLAKLALNGSGMYERAVIEAICHELSARLAPYKVTCSTASSFAAHFIIIAEGLFFCKASVLSDDDTSWTCTYQWHFQETHRDIGDRLVLFHNPLATIVPDVLIATHLSDTSSNYTDTPSPNHLAEQQNMAPTDDGDEMNVDCEGQDELRNQMPTQHSNSLPTFLEEILVPLNDRERQAIELRYGLQDGNTRTLEVVGTVFGCTRARIGQIELKAFKKIRASAPGMRKIREALITLEAALQQADGVLSIPIAAQKLGLVTDINEQHEVAEDARVRFLLSFCKTIDIPKGTALVALKHDIYETAFSELPDACAALQRILRKAPYPLHIEAIVDSLETNTRGEDIVTRIPKATLIACLAALPQVSVNEQGCYYLVGRTFDVPQPAIYRPEAKPPPQRVREVKDRMPAGSLKSAPKVKGKVDGLQPELPWESYDIWNHAIGTYVTVGAQRGSTVYLSIDDEVIEQIGRHLQAQEGQPLEAFLKAIQHRVVQGRRIVLEQIHGQNRHGEPNCIAFLAAMVLAASRMAEDEEEEIASSNYFARFCEVLDLDQDNGRPRGIRFGADDEEPLWREWAVWLGEIGLISSALPGEGAKRYINYPISQALLRSTDRVRLRRLFTDLRWYESWDHSTLITALRRDSYRLSTHLRTLLADQSQRIEAVTEAVYEVYEEWLSRASSDQSDGQIHGHVLLADVMRNEDLISGDIEYLLYPRSPRRQQLDNVVVQIGDQTYTLLADRPGWYMPLCTIDEQLLHQGGRFPIEQPASVDALVLPRRSFWLLSPDPENTEAGVYASWGAVPLGTSFIILCRRDLIPQLEFLRAERLIEWSGDTQALSSIGDWVEVPGCMVISPAWDGVEIESRELHEALRPRVSLSISLSGGLRAPQGGWLLEFGPQVTIFGFPPEAEVMVTRITDSYKLLEDIRPTNRPFDVAWPASGDYLVEVVSGTTITRRLVKIIDWEELEVAPVTKLEWLKIGELHLCGALMSVQIQGDEDATLV